MNRILTAFWAFASLPGAAAAPRPPAVAGTFYPGDPKALASVVEGYLAEAPEASGEGLVALLVPHAGYEFSGRTAAAAYKAVRGRWDSVIVLGTGHHKAVGGAALYPGDYATPEGSVPYDEALGRELLKASPLISPDPAAHGKEHSVEVQLPFLRRRLGDFKMVAMVMNVEDAGKAKAIGRAIAKVARGKRVLVVASSDQSHYPDSRDAAAVDRTTLEALQTLDPDYFWLANRVLLKRGVSNLAVTYCGEGAVTAVMAAAKELGATEARVLGRSNSGDAAPGTASRVVGYAGVAFLKTPGSKPKEALSLPDAEKRELLGLARRSISEYLSVGARAPVPLSANPRFNLPAAVFVTLYGPGGELRGCVGSPAAHESLAESVARNAVQSAVADKRFAPVQAGELPALRVSIDVLSRPRPARSAEEIKAGDGVIVERDGKTGVFLPQVWRKLPKKEDFLGELCALKLELPRECWRDPGTSFKVFSADVFEESPSPKP